MEEDGTKVIVVLGMHRSGTSVITRGLQVLGVELGNQLMPPFEGNNSKGFWEDVDINGLNIEMLDSLNSEWHFLTPIQPADVDTLCKNGYLQRAVDLLRAKTSGAKVFGFKDPRVAKLLPFWKEVFAQGQLNVEYVLVIRHPLSVGDSLAKRDGFDIQKSHLLWLEHVIGSLVGTAGANRVLVDYDTFMRSPETELTRVAHKLQLTIRAAELQEFQDEFLDHQLRHTIYQLDELMQDRQSPPLVQEVYSSLVATAAGDGDLENPLLKDKIAQWYREFSRMRSALVLADSLGTKLATITAERDALIAERNRLLRERTEARQDVLAKEQAMQNLKTELLAIQQSRMWRWTQPLRRFLSLFRQTK
jgi:O-antigen biosynthesis protein